MTQCSDASPCSNWPDVAIAYIEWARTDIVTFGIAHFVVAVIVYVLAPRTAKLIRKEVDDAVVKDRANREKKDE